MSDDDYIHLWPNGDQKRAITKMFRMWSKRLLRSAAAHYMAAERFEARDTLLTRINMVSAIAVLFFSTNQKIAAYLIEFFLWIFQFEGVEYTGKISLLVPLFSLFVVLSSAWQYIAQYSKKAMEHKQAANEFSNLRRKIERYWTKDKIHLEAIHSLNRSYNATVKNPPIVPRGIWKKALKSKKEEIDQINRFFYNFEGEDDSIEPESCP